MRYTNNILFICVFLLLSGCHATPKNINNWKASENTKLKLPIDEKLLVHISEKNKTKIFSVTNVAGKVTHWKMYEGQALESASLKVFNKVFNKVSPSIENTKGELLAVMSGDSFINTSMGAYRADVTFDIYTREGALLGRYGGRGDYQEGQINDTFALENAFVDAVMKAVEIMLEDKKISAYFN